MAIRFQCHACGKTLSVKDELRGKRVKCPCGAVVVATAASSGAAAARPAQPATTKAAASKLAASRAARQPVAAAQSAANPYGTDAGDLSDLFDELTDSDWQTKRERDEAAAQAEAAVIDPLAGYQPSGKGATSGGSRPVGLTILAVLNFLLAALAMSVGVVLLVGTQMLGDMLQDVEMLQNIATFVAVLVLVAGIFYAAVGAGLLSRQPWGWWLSATVYSYNLFDRIFFIIFSLIEGVPIATASKGAGALLFAAGLLSYLFNEETRRHFQMKTKPGIAAAITIGSMCLFALVVHVVLHLMAGDAPPG